MATTLADVARRSGVSVATVSRVLNNKMVMPIPPATIERIRRAAEELGYRPNPMARALATGRTHTLGLFSLEMTDPHFAQMLEAVESRARASAYHLIVSSALDEVSRKGRVDGVVVLGSPANEMFASLPARLPTVFVYNSYELRPNLVGWSDEEGMRLAVEHLVDLGHRHIAALFCYGEEKYTPPPEDAGIRRADHPSLRCPRAVLAQHPKVSGFRKAVQQAGIEAIECWEAPRPDQIPQGYQFENGYLATRRLLSEKQPFTAIVARNDFLALGALRALREFGVSVPQEVSVIGYTDSLHALCADPPLTSVLTPIAQAGELAVERLIRSIEQGEEPLSGAILSTSLTIRLSCAPPPGGTRQQGGEARVTPMS